MGKSLVFLMIPLGIASIYFDSATRQDIHIFNGSTFHSGPSHDTQGEVLTGEYYSHCTKTEIPQSPGQDSSTYYTQHTSILGILIKAPESVAPRALLEAQRIITILLKHIRLDIRERLVSKKASLAIIPRNQFVTSLPEFSYLSGRLDINGNPYDSFRIRGLGAKRQPVTATSEENLLKLPDDPFRAEDITVHEFAHAIMNLGFSPNDLLRIDRLYQEALSKGRFQGCFAMARVDEFWAELTQSFFSVNNEIGGPEQISEGDLDSYRFLELIYGFNPLQK